MDWIERMNRVINYVEEHLCYEIDYIEISHIAACPIGIFQRMFSLTTEIPLSEYIRRRKLTCAAYEIQSTNCKIIDIAVKYGYESADAFTVSFKKLHGVAPKMARQPDVKLKSYPRLSFTLTIKGVVEMDYRIVERETFKVIGIRRTTPYGGGTWGIVKGDGTAQILNELRGAPCNLGLCFGFDEEGNDDYMCGIEYKKKDTPAGFDTYLCPSSSWIVFEAYGTVTSGILGDTWKRIYGEFLPQSVYIQSDLPTIEDYREWNEETDICKVDIWIPIEKQHNQ